MSAEQGARSTYNVHTACIRGVEAWPVTVEVSMGGGIPGISIVGMAENSVLEARVRIRCALKSCGFDLPRRSIIVNLAPGDVRKTGTGFDLPIAVAILALSGQINLDGLDDKLFIGELGLDGDVLPCRGEVAYGMLARDVGLELVTARPETHIPLEGVRHRYLDGLGSLLAASIARWHLWPLPANGTTGLASRSISPMSSVRIWRSARWPLPHAVAWA